MKTTVGGFCRLPGTCRVGMSCLAQGVVCLVAAGCLTKEAVWSYTPPASSDSVWSRTCSLTVSNVTLRGCIDSIATSVQTSSQGEQTARIEMLDGITDRNKVSQLHASQIELGELLSLVGLIWNTGVVFRDSTAVLGQMISGSGSVWITVIVACHFPDVKPRVVSFVCHSMDDGPYDDISMTQEVSDGEICRMELEVSGSRARMSHWRDTLGPEPPAVHRPDGNTVSVMALAPAQEPITRFVEIGHTSTTYTVEFFFR